MVELLDFSKQIGLHIFSVSFDGMIILILGSALNKKKLTLYQKNTFW